MRKIVAALVLALSFSAQAEAADPDYGKLVAAVGARFLAPRYKALADAGRDNASAWKSFCGGKAEPALADLRNAHRALALAFSTVQAFRFGPVGEGSTAERLYFWPERKGAVAKGLAALMEGQRPDHTGAHRPGERCRPRYPRFGAPSLSRR